MADNDNNLVFTVSSDMTAAQRGLTKFVGDIGTATNQIAKKYEQAGTKIDSSISGLQARINGMVGLGAKASKEWTGALSDQGKELERLRARYSPLFATINQYKTAVADIKRAHALGAISANEMSAAISKERQAALASTAAIKGRNAALAATPVQRQGGSASGFQTANIAAQFQDIAVTSAMGMNPLQIALQQGTQLSSVLNTMGSGRQVIAGLGAAFASLVSPVSLVTIGLIAGGAAAIQYFSSVSMGGTKSEETLKKEAELIQQVADKWGDVLPELKKYAEERQKLADQKEQKDAVAAAASQQWEQLRKDIGQTQVTYAQFLQTFNDLSADTSKVGDLQKAYKTLSEGIADGTATSEEAKAVQAALLALFQETGIKAVGDFAKTFDVLAASIEKASDRAAKLKSDAAFVTEFAKSTLPVLGTVGPVYSDSGKLMTDPLEIERYNKQQQDNRNPTIDTGRGLPVSVPTPTAKPIQLGEEPDKAIEKQETAAQKAANAYRDLKKSADDRIGQMRQEIELLGTYGVEADAARFALDLLQQSEDKGRSLSEAQKKELAEKVELYRQYSEVLAKTKLAQDLAQQARFNSLSKEDQQVSTTLKQYGLADDLGSSEAGQIRQSLRTEGIRDEVRSFATNFKDALLNNGGDIGKAFAETLQRAMLDAASKSLDRLIDQFVNAIVGGGAGASGGGASGVGAVAAGIFSGGSGAKSVSGSGSAVDLASALTGFTETGNTGSINSFLKKGGVDINAAQTAWCAGFVNSSLEQIGIKGSGSLTANSFQNWGSKIDPSQVLRGDVLLQSRGLGAGSAGGHVGFATGATRMGDNGLQLQMLSGNSGKFGAVDTSWIDATQLQVKRATEAASALKGVAGSAGAATQGLGQLGQLSSNFFPAAPQGGGGGGGIFSWLSGLFSGPFKPIGAQAGLAAAGGVGLYADGGHVAGPGGPTDDNVPAWLSNGEFVVNARATRKHRAMLEAINTGRISRFATGGIVSPRLVSAPVAPSLAPRAQAGGSSRSGPDVMVIHLDGANGDDHVMALAKQAVTDGLGQYNKNQERGGFGTVQGQFTKRKG